MEWYNPFGSVKDRAAFYMIKGAEANGSLRPGFNVLIEPTSGNTGVALAGIAKALGYKAEVVIPAQTSLETKRYLKRLNVKIWEVTEELNGGFGYGIEKAISLTHDIMKEQHKKYFMPNQYENCENVRAHYESTGPEIWRQTRGKISHFVAGIGTGGTIIGVGKFLKKRNSKIKVYAVEPINEHHIQGLRSLEGSNATKILDENKEIIDGWIKVSDSEAFTHADELYKKRGFSAGPSSGAAYYGALKVAEEADKGMVVTIFPDGRDRHKSTFKKWSTNQFH